MFLAKINFSLFFNLNREFKKWFYDLHFLILSVMVYSSGSNLLKYLSGRGNMKTEILQVRNDILFSNLFNEKDIKAAIMGSISDLRM